MQIIRCPLALAVVAALTLLLTVGCAAGAPTAAPAKPVAELDFGMTYGGASFYMPFFVAHKYKTFLADEGLKVTFTDLGPPELAAAITSGSVQVALVSTARAGRAKQQGSKIQLVAGFHKTTPYDLVSQPSIASPQELRGKIIGTGARVSSLTAMLYPFMKGYGLEKDRDYTVLDAGGIPSRLAALVSRSIDAAVLSDPATFRAAAQGFRVLGSLSDKVPYNAFNTFWVNEDWAKRNEAQVVGFMKALIRATDWLYNPANKEEAIQMFADHFQLSPDYAQATYKKHVEDVKTWTPRLAILKEAIEGAFALEVEAGIMPSEQVPPLEQLINSQYYDRAIKALGS